MADAYPSGAGGGTARLGVRPFATEAEATLLCDAFAACTLPKAAWTHRAHLTAALWHLDHHPAHGALALMRDAIKRYNRSVGTVDSATEGYHETITVFYMRVTARFKAAWSGSASFADRANGLYAEWGDRNLPLRHYSRERLFSVEARAQWIEPDLDPIPALSLREGAPSGDERA
ncbi:MAG: hypothetical protein ABI647_00275 [Gemmatimonadota bacterium]